LPTKNERVFLKFSLHLVIREHSDLMRTCLFIHRCIYKCIVLRVDRMVAKYMKLHNARHKCLFLCEAYRKLLVLSRAG